MANKPISLQGLHEHLALGNPEPLAYSLSEFRQTVANSMQRGYSLWRWGRDLADTGYMFKGFSQDLPLGTNFPLNKQGEIRVTNDLRVAFAHALTKQGLPNEGHGRINVWNYGGQNCPFVFDMHFLNRTSHQEKFIRDFYEHGTGRIYVLKPTSDFKQDPRHTFFYSANLREGVPFQLKFEVGGPDWQALWPNSGAEFYLGRIFFGDQSYWGRSSIRKKGLLSPIKISPIAQSLSQPATPQVKKESRAINDKLTKPGKIDKMPAPTKTEIDDLVSFLRGNR